MAGSNVPVSAQYRLRDPSMLSNKDPADGRTYYSRTPFERERWLLEKSNATGSGVEWLGRRLTSLQRKQYLELRQSSKHTFTFKEHREAGALIITVTVVGAMR